MKSRQGSRQDRDKIETQKKNDKKEKKEKTTTPLPPKGGVGVVFYECLKDNKELNEDEREILQKYDERRVKLALDFAKIEKPKTSLIRLLVWHCQQKNPPQPRERVYTTQQRMAIEFNKYLLSIGQELLYQENKQNIEDGAYLLIPLNGNPVPVSLANDPLTLKSDFEQSKRDLKLKFKHG